MSKLTNEEILFQITRLTERAIALIESGHLNESLDMIENRDRAVNILLASEKIEDTLAPALSRLDQLNEKLLEKLLTAKQQSQLEIVDTHTKSQLHKAYQSTQVK